MIEEAGSSSSSSEDCSPSKKPKTESFVEIKDLVTFMIKDPFLIENWSQFSDFLGLQTQDKKRWTRGINNLNFNYYEIFSEMLRSWVSSTNLKKRTVRELCEVLTRINCVSVAETLEENFLEDEVINLPPGTERKSEFVRSPSSKEIKWPITHSLLVPASNFSGREKELTELNSTFNSDKTNLILICGFGGIGKTELCKKFGNEITRSNTNITISRIWLHGERIGTLWDSILEIAMELGVKNDGTPSPSEYFKYMASMILEKCDRLWVVIDNVDVIYEEVTEVIKTVQLAKISGKLFVIVTSRDKNILEGAGITLQLDVLSKEETRIMLQSSMESLTNSDADKLGELVQYFPLALQQAVAYIKQQRSHFRTSRYGVSNYVEEFEQKKSKMLDQKLNKYEHEYSLTTLLTWDLTIEKMTKGAVEILKVLAYLNPDGILLDFLERICERKNLIDFDFDQAFNMIYNYSLVKIERAFVVSIHRLIQEVIRGKVQGGEEYCKMLFSTVLLACKKKTFAENKQKFLGACERYKDKGPTYSEKVVLKSVHRFAWKCEMESVQYFHDALLILLEWDRKDCAVKYCGAHLTNLNFNLDEVKRKEFLEKVFLWSFISKDSVNGDFDSVTNEIIEKGKYTCDRFWLPANRKSLEMGLKISEKYFGHKSQITFTVKNYLVRKLTSEEDIERALTVCEELLTSFPLDDLAYVKVYVGTIATLVSNLYKLHRNFGTRNSSHLDRVLKIIDDFNTLYSSNDSLKETMRLEAEVLELKGDLKKAVELYQKLILNFNNDDEYFKPFKYKVVELKMMIKLTDFNTITKEEIEREFSEDKIQGVNWSLPDLERILNFYHKILGDDHPLTVGLKIDISGKLNYISCASDQERCTTLCEQVLDSPCDKQYQRAFYMIVVAKNIRYDYEQQKKLLEQLLTIKKLKLGEKHSSAIRILQLLAKTMEKSGKFLVALDLYTKVRDLAKEMECWDEDDLKRSRANVQALKLRLGDFSGVKTRDDLYKAFGEFDGYGLSFSIKQLDKIWNFYKSILGDGDELTLRVVDAMVEKLDLGDKTCKELVEKLEQIRLRNNEDVKFALVEEFGEDDFDIMMELRERVVRFLISLFGKNYSDTVTAKECLNNLFETLGDSVTL